MEDPMRTHRAAPALLALALLVGASGCGEAPDRAAGPVATSGPSDAPTTATPPAADPTEAAAPAAGLPPFGTGLRPVDGGYGSGNELGLTGVRTSRHDGYDRVVFDLGGTGRPGWYVDYTDDPVSDGSGEPVEIDGSAVLQVVLRGIGLPDDVGLPAYGDSTTRVPATGTTGVIEIAPGGVFEGDQLAYIGLRGAERAFRVFALTTPARLVVDVRHP
ncbi:MAG: hypothetical protein F2667_04250 [Actinobacteria bacterium]|nr:hypothetical protein [Actinomycetota bacterium]